MSMFDELSDTTKFFLRMSAEIDDLEKQRDVLLEALKAVLTVKLDPIDSLEDLERHNGVWRKVKAAIALAVPLDEVRSE